MINFDVKIVDSLTGHESRWDVAVEGIGSKYFVDGLEKAITEIVSNGSKRVYTLTKWLEEFDEKDPTYMKVNFGYDLVETTDNESYALKIEGVALAYDIREFANVV